MTKPQPNPRQILEDFVVAELFEQKRPRKLYNAFLEAGYTEVDYRKGAKADVREFVRKLLMSNNTV